MQNFKQFLKEEKTSILQDYENFKYPVICKGFEFKTGEISRKYFKNDEWTKDGFLQVLNSEIKKLFKMDNVEAVILREQIYSFIQVEIYYGITDNQQGTNDNLNEFFNLWDKLLQQEFPETKNRYVATCWVNAPLQVILEFPEVNLDFAKNKNVSLSGINKFLNCEYILLSGGENISSSMLSLLLIKRLKKLIHITDNDTKLIDIFNKHLSSGKDILECQEELITNGYRQYAKL
jgi:hypothetical protein